MNTDDEIEQLKKAIILYEELSQSLRNKTSEIIEIKNQIEILSNKLDELKVEKEHIIEDINNL